MTRSYSASDASDAATATAATTGPLNCVRDAHAAGISYETSTAVKLSSNSQSIFAMAATKRLLRLTVRQV